MVLPKGLAMILLGIWLILFSLMSIPSLGFNFSHGRDVLAVLGIVAGVILIWKRGG